MAPRALVVAFSLIAATSPLYAASQDPELPVAPAGTPETKYCMRIVLTGNIIEPLRCWTREEWAEQDVDVDKEWAEEGVKVIG